MGVVGRHFRPEFINRVDETVVFHPLAEEQIRGIANIQVESLRHRLAERDLALQLSDEVLDHLAEAGFDPVFGARPLKRAIQQLLENPLAQQILQGDYAPGDTIQALVEGQKIILSRQH
jgi:ATP-dependent Clp protease ATP-binding subunit ClpB